MARQWKKKPTGARRRPNLRRKRGYKPNSNLRSLNPIPQHYLCKMKYSETFTTESSTGNFQFNLNSIFDPNRTGIGHQPYGHDTMNILYNRYRVISCSWRIQQGQNAQSGVPINIAVMPANEVLIFSTVSEMRENPRSKYIVQNPGAPAVALTGKQYIPSLMGRTKIQYMSDDRYQAQMGSSPLEFAILNIATSTGGDSFTPATLQIVLEYTVEFFDVKHLAQS